MRTTSTSLVCLLFVAAVIEGCSARESPPPPPLDIHAGQFISAERCGECHRDIYQVWTSSLHASALTNATFQGSLQQISQDASATATCLGCHSPVATESKLPPDAPVAREGVTCDYCHSIREMEPKSGLVRAVLDVGPVKYGPVANAHSTGHQVGYSPLHAQSEVCAGCHEYENTAGLKVLGTFSEWKTSDQAKAGMTCQRCHMPLSTLNVVDPRVKRDPSSFVNLHKMPGGHSKDQLFKALELRILEVTRHGSDLQVKVTVNNKGAGHNVPTGMPTRQIVLTTGIAGADSGSQQQTRIYGSAIQDRSGRRVDRDSQVILIGATYASDTRLKPGEIRTEIFKFKIKPDENVDVSTSLTYKYTPLGTDQQGVEIPFFERHQQSVVQWTGDKPTQKEKQ